MSLAQISYLLETVLEEAGGQEYNMNFFSLRRYHSTVRESACASQWVVEFVSAQILSYVALHHYITSTDL